MGPRKSKWPDKATTEAHVQNIVDGMHETDAMEACATYLARGRPLEMLSDGELLRVWAIAFRSMMLDRSPESFRDVDDAHSELRLRKDKPDPSLIRHALDVVRADLVQSLQDNLEGDAVIQSSAICPL